MFWKDRCINSTEKFSNILEILQRAEGCVLYVVNEKDVLLGTITDGDLRRFLLQGDKSELTLVTGESIMNKNYHCEVAGEIYNRDISDYEKFKEIPLCDDEGVLIDVIRLGGDNFIPIASPSLGALEKKYLNRCFNSTFISSNSSMVVSFEKAFLNIIDAQYGTSVSNGTAALELIIRTLNLPEGAKIGVPNCTFAASINSIINCGYTPIIIDINSELLIDENKIPWTELHAVIYVSLYGNAFNIKSVSELAKANGVILIGDHAEGLGCQVAGLNIDSYCDASSYSFFANKLITTGEGGFVTFREGELLEKALVIKNHGMNPKIKYDHIEIGCNYRMTGLQASVGLAQLEQLPDFLKKRREIGEAYTRILDGRVNISVLDQSFEGHRSSFWLFPLIMQEDFINELEKTFMNNMIEVRRLFQPLSEMSIYSSYVLEGYNYQKIDGIVLPTHPGLSHGDITKIVNVIDLWEKQLQ